MLSRESLCRRGFVAPPSLLKAVFELEEVPVGNEVERYRKKYEKNCKELAGNYLDRIGRKKFGIRCSELHDEYIRKKFVWTGSSDDNFKKFVERTMNSVYFGMMNCLNWSQWLLLTDEGQHLLDRLANGRNKTERNYALATLQIYLVQIYISLGYDDVLFHKEFFRILPSLDKVLAGDPLLKKIMHMSSSFAVGKVLLSLLKNAMIKYYKVPEKFFKHFTIISPDETIFIGSKDEEKENDS